MESGKQATEEHLPDWPLACSSLAGTEGGEEQDDSDVADGAGWELPIRRRLERMYPGTKGVGTKGRGCVNGAEGMGWYGTGNGTGWELPRR